MSAFASVVSDCGSPWRPVASDQQKTNTGNPTRAYHTPSKIRKAKISDRMLLDPLPPKHTPSPSTHTHTHTHESTLAKTEPKTADPMRTHCKLSGCSNTHTHTPKESELMNHTHTHTHTHTPSIKPVSNQSQAWMQSTLVPNISSLAANNCFQNIIMFVEKC